MFMHINTIYVFAVQTFTSSERQPFEDNTYSSDSLSNGESGIASTGEEGTVSWFFFFPF